MRHPSILEPLTRLDAFDRLWRQKRVFLAVFLAVIGAAVAALVLLPVRYLATASVIVAEQEPGVANTSPAWAQKIGDPADLESQLLVIRSPRLLRQVMNAPGVVPAIVEECEHGLSLGSAERCRKLSTDPDQLHRIYRRPVFHRLRRSLARDQHLLSIAAVRTSRSGSPTR